MTSGTIRPLLERALANKKCFKTRAQPKRLVRVTWAKLIEPGSRDWVREGGGLVGTESQTRVRDRPNVMEGKEWEWEDFERAEEEMIEERGRGVFRTQREHIWSVEENHG
jgi:hypothetical protein